MDTRRRLVVNYILFCFVTNYFPLETVFLVWQCSQLVLNQDIILDTLRFYECGQSRDKKIYFSSEYKSWRFFMKKLYKPALWEPGQKHFLV